MNIAIVGAGFTGLSAAWELRKAGHQVTVFEAEAKPGGLATGFSTPEWQWSLERHYHHIFTSDEDIINFAKELHLEDQILFKRVKTTTRYNGVVFPLDSVRSLLACPVLSPISKIRTGAVLAFLRFFPYARWMESITAAEFIQKTMGKESWQVVWKPLFFGKFGEHTNNINAAWFWARIYVRSSQLGYFKGGFLNFAQQAVKKLQQEKVLFFFETPIKEVHEEANQFSITFMHESKKTLYFDKVLVAAPAPVLTKIIKQLPSTYTQQILNLESLAAVTLVIELDDHFFADGTYWLNVNEKKWPFLAVVEHTHFMDSQKYGGKHLLYVGKYCTVDSALYQMSDDQLWKHYLPYLKQLNPKIVTLRKRSWVFRESFAQPIVGLHHHLKVPELTTPIPNLYWASMQHVYPWDRGTNYAVQIGKKVAAAMMA